MNNYDFTGMKRPAAIEEDDPLWQYLSQIRDGRTMPPEGEGQYRRDINQGYREQNAMNDIIPTLAKAGANMGTIGGVTARTVLGDKKYADPRADALKYEGKEDDSDIKRQMLYGTLAGKLSEKIAGKTKAEQMSDRLASDAQRREAELKDKRDRDAAELAYKKARDDADRAAKLAEAAANRAAKAGESEADRKLREKLAADALAAAKQKADVAAKIKGTVPPREANASDKNIALFAASMKEASKKIDDLDKKGYKPTSIVNTTKREGFVGKAADYLNLSNDDDRLYRASEAQWKNAYIRKVTGAGMNATEAEREAEAFFPTVNASPQVVEELKQRRKKVEDNFSVLAGRAGTGMKGGEPSKGGNNKTRPIVEPKVKVKAPDGSIKLIPKSMLQKALDAGGTLVEGGQ